MREFSRHIHGIKSWIISLFLTTIDIHDDIALPNNYLNLPPWIVRIFFKSDEAEIFYNDIKPDWEDNE